MAKQRILLTNEIIPPPLVRAGLQGLPAIIRPWRARQPVIARRLLPVDGAVRVQFGRACENVFDRAGS